jgi:hypothetical protein
MLCDVCHIRHIFQARILREQLRVMDLCGLPDDGISHGELVGVGGQGCLQKLLVAQHDDSALAHELEHLLCGSEATVADHVFAHFVDAQAGYDQVSGIEQGRFEKAGVCTASEIFEPAAGIDDAECGRLASDFCRFFDHGALAQR